MPTYTLADEQVSQVPDFSPGPVESCEDLLRTGFYPEHFKGDKLGPAAIPLAQLKGSGVSTDRAKFANQDVLLARANELQKRNSDTREKAYVASLCCGQVRAIKLDENSSQAFVVIDDALEENPAHASIYSAEVRSDKELRKLRNQLLPLLSNLITLEQHLEQICSA